MECKLFVKSKLEYSIRSSKNGHKLTRMTVKNPQQKSYFLAPEKSHLHD